jgi:hypothetical protein
MKPSGHGVAVAQADEKVSKPDKAPTAMGVSDREQIAVAAFAPSWLGSWIANVSPDSLASGLDDAAIDEPDPALRAEMRRRGISARRSGEPVSDASVVVAERPLPYCELLDRLQGKKPAGQGGLRELMQ